MLRIDDYATFRRVATPFYYYDIDLFMRTVDKVADLSEKTGIQVHYSVKANSDSRLGSLTHNFSHIITREASSLFFLSNLFSIFVVYISKYHRYETCN